MEKKSDSPDEDKSAGDAQLLIPTLQDFFKAHPLINPKTFLGDMAFDSAKLYRELLTGDTFGTGGSISPRHFEKAYIPLRKNTKFSNTDYNLNADGIPCCPKDASLPFRCDGKSHRKNGLVRYKFVCPKIKWTHTSDGRHHRQCVCENPCTNARCGKMVHIYPERDLRAYPGTIRGTDEWMETYKIRTTVERSINQLKSSFCLAGRRTQNAETLHADLLLSGITQMIGVIQADEIHQHKYIRSVKPLAS